MFDELKSRAISGALGVGFTALAWLGTTTVATKTATEINNAQLAQQAQQLQRATERIESIERLEARSVAVQESMQRVLDRLEQRADDERKPKR